MARRTARLIGTGLMALACGVAPAWAEPPAVGTTHTFHDPVFRGTVFCDTLDDVWSIATAEQPDEIYGLYRVTTNARDEPICMAIVPTALVVEVTPIGVMKRNGHDYNAWAVETDVGGVTAFALYLERVTRVAA
jgi:hypothetical protein